MNVFVTGASSGIGAALARHYAARGDRCTLVARRLDALDAVRRTLVGPERHVCRAVDVNDAEALAAAAHATIASSGVPDIVIANAGISGGTGTGEPDDLAAFRRIVETNLLATVATFAPFVAAMRSSSTAQPAPSTGRRLVVIASVAGVRGIPGSGAYSASKAAAIAYAESLRIELRATPIRVVTIAPGFIDTPMTVHNPYPMPFLMPVDAFARRAVDAIDAGRRFVVVPWPMAWVARFLRILPPAWYDAAIAGRGRKPRLADPP